MGKYWHGFLLWTLLGSELPGTPVPWMPLCHIRLVLLPIQQERRSWGRWSIEFRPVVLQLGCILEFIKGALNITDAWLHSQKCQFSLGGTQALVIFKCSMVILLHPGWEPLVCHTPFWSGYHILYQSKEKKTFPFVKWFATVLICLFLFLWMSDWTFFTGPV